MSLVQFLPIDCPYCGERIEIEVDRSAGDQEYIEDCTVCCRPITVLVVVSGQEFACVEARREDE